MPDWGAYEGPGAAIFAVTQQLIVESAKGYTHHLAGEDDASMVHMTRIWSRIDELSPAEVRSALVDTVAILGGIRGHIAAVGIDGDPLVILQSLGLAPHELTGA